MLLEIQSKLENDNGILSLNGVLDVSTIENFKSSLESISEAKNVIIDFQNVKFIDSTGIGGLAQVIKKLRENNVGVKVTNISTDVFEVLDILGLPEIFGEDTFEVQV